MIWEFLVGAILIYIILRLFFVRQDDTMRGNIKVSHPYTSRDVITFKVEKINDIYYLWDKDSEDFLAQGATVEKAIEVMIERYPDKVFRSDNVIAQA